MVRTIITRLALLDVAANNILPSRHPNYGLGTFALLQYIAGVGFARVGTSRQIAVRDTKKERLVSPHHIENPGFPM